MNSTIFAALIGGLSVVAVALINGYSLKKAARDKREIKGEITNLTIHIDGRMTELLELTRKSSHAEGVEDQKIVQQEEQN